MYSVDESLEILKLKMQTLSSFSGRSKLDAEDKKVYWSIYGLLEILETYHS